MRPPYPLLAALALAAPVAAGAQETKKVEPVVVTATTVATPAEQLGASVSVVTDEDLKTYHYPTLDEALRGLPGVDIVRSGSYGKLSTISIRGANSSQVLVLVDGVRVNSPTAGTADLSDISPDLIERIEIIRGAQSALYGADAMGGVMNIITKKGSGPFSASTSQEIGNYGTWVSRGTVTGTYKLLDYALSGSHFESNGQLRNDDSDINALNARLGLSLPLGSSLGFVARYNRTATGLPVKFVSVPLPRDPVIDPNANQQSESLVLSLEGKTRPLPWWEIGFRASRYTNHLGFQDLPDPGFPGEIPTVSQIDTERREAAVTNSFSIGTWSTTTVGAEYRHERGDNVHVFAASDHTWSVFGEQQLRFFDRLFLTAGFRWEDNSVFTAVATGRGSLAYVMKEWGTRFHASGGSGFRAPTINDLFFPGFSNPSLQPERSTSYDVGVDQKLWKDRIRVGATYFHTEFNDLIVFLPIATPPFVEAQNVGRARSQGVELTAETDLLYNLVASFNYTYTDTKDLDTGRPLPRVPKNRWSIGLTWEPIPRLSLFTQVRILTEQFDPLGDVFNPGYTTVDVGGAFRLLGRWGLLEKLELTARVQNLLNQNYEEVQGFPALGTNFLVGLRASF